MTSVAALSSYAVCVGGPSSVKGLRMLLDTDVMVDILRGHPPAVAWLAGLGSTAVALPGIVAMELIQGCRSLAEQQRLERILQRFNFHWPSAADCQGAYVDFAAYYLSNNLGLLDSLIAHTALGRSEDLATFNIKHYSVVAGLRTVQPY
jgi:predicted nucleic acid-binding protein